MHVIGFLMDFVRPSFVIAIGGVRFTCASADQAWPLIEARAGRAVQIHLSVPATLTTPSEARWVGIEILHEHFLAVEQSRHPPCLWIRDRYSWLALWRFKMTMAHDIAREVEECLLARFAALNPLPVNGWIPLPGLDGVDWDHWRKDRDIMPPDLDDDPVGEPPQDELMSAASAPRMRTWAIEPIAQRKKTTLLSGEPGMGKSQIALAFASCITRGEGLPNLREPPDGPAGVMVNETEDDWTEDVIPRLMAAGANRKLIKGFYATDLHTREGVMKLDAAKKRFEAQIKKPVRMLILSPYMACFGGGSTQEQAMRQKLVEIERWQRETDIAILGVAHLGGTGDVAGPKTFKRAARGSWKVVIDEDDPEKDPKKKRRLLLADKVNNTADDFRLAYRIKGVTLKRASVEGDDVITSKIVWEDANTSNTSTSDTSNTPHGVGVGVEVGVSPTLTQMASEEIKSILQDGPKESRDVIAEMIKRGYAESTVHYAKKKLGIEGGGRGRSGLWALA